MPVFVGKRIQRGHGLGGVFASLAKNILLPVVKNIGTALITSGLQKTTRAIEDVGKGKSIKAAFKDQFASAPKAMLKSGTKRAANVLNQVAHADEPKPKKRKVVKRANVRRRRDVFDL